MKNKLLPFLFLLVAAQLSFSQKPDEVSRLNDLLAHATHDTTRAYAYAALAEKLVQSNIDTVIPLSEKALEIVSRNLDKSSPAEKDLYKKVEAACHQNIAYVYKSRGDIAQAFEHFDKSQELYSAAGNKKGVAEIIKSKSEVYGEIGDFNKSLDLLYLSLKMNQELDPASESTAKCLNSLGYLYEGQNDNEKALGYYKEALKIVLQSNNRRGMAYCYGSIANIYKNKNDFDHALEYVLKSLDLMMEVHDEMGVANCYNKIGFIYKIRQDIPKALEYITKSLKKREEIHDRKGMATSLVNVGSIYLIMKDTRNAEKYALQGMQVSRELGFPANIKIAAELLKRIYLEKRDYPNAYKMFELFVTMRDSMSSVETRKAAEKKQVIYEFGKKMVADSLKNEQKAKLTEARHDHEINRQRTIRNSLIIGSLLLVLLAGVIYRSLLQTKKARRIIELQKAQAEKQRDQISHQKNEIEEQKHIVEEKNKEILDSITYAKRLQEAILPPDKLVKEHFPESFILYRPKDIVAGDFYWMEVLDDRVLIAAADCTGHGVPGAMVSVVCSNSLNRAVKEFGLREPGQILDKTRELVVETFEKSESEVKDGMDISLCSFHRGKGTLSWAGANNSLWYLENGQIKEIKANKQPIGKMDSPAPFTTHSLQLSPGTLVYLFTDGYADQFGGEKGKKFKYKQLEELLASHAREPMRVQQKVLFETLEAWRGGLEQVDDVLIIGIKTG